MYNVKYRRKEINVCEMEQCTRFLTYILTDLLNNSLMKRLYPFMKEETRLGKFKQPRVWTWTLHCVASHSPCGCLLTRVLFSFLIFKFFIYFLLFAFLGPYLQHMEVPRLGVESQLAYNPATAMGEPSHICDLHHSWQQCWILNPLSEARDRTWIVMGTGQIHNHKGSP